MRGEPRQTTLSFPYPKAEYGLVVPGVVEGESMSGCRRRQAAERDGYVKPYGDLALPPPRSQRICYHAKQIHAGSHWVDDNDFVLTPDQGKYTG